MFSRVLISLGSVLLILCVEKISALSTMLVGSAASMPHGDAIYSSYMFGGDNSTVSFDSHDGMTRLHGSGLKVQVDLLEIVTERGTFTTGPTHTEFQQVGDNVPSWAQLYSDDEMTVYYNDEPVLQLAGGSDASITVNGMGYFVDVAIDKKSAKLIGMAICGAKNSISGSSGHACDAAAFTTVGQMLVAVVQGQLDISQQLAQTGGPVASNSASNKGGGITDAELGAHMKSALASFEAQLLTGKPLKNVVAQYTEGLAKHHTEHAQKQEDLYMRMQTALGELSRNAATADGEINQLRERMHVAEAEGGASGKVKDEVSKLRATIKEIDNGIVKSHADLVASIDKKASSLASQIAESDTKTYTGLLSVAQQGWYNITVARDDLRNDITTLQKRADTATDANVAVQTELARIDAAVTTAAAAAAEVGAKTEKVKNELSGDIEKVGSSMQSRLGALETSVLAAVEAVNTAMTDKLTEAHSASAANAATIAQLAHNTSEVTDEISTAVAKSNGILSRVIGEMNATLVATAARADTNAHAHQELQQRVDKGLAASLANLTSVENALRGELSVAKERQEAAIASVNATTLDILALAETRLLHGIDEISREVTAVESAVKGVMTTQSEQMRSQMAAMNAAATQALEEALARVGRELGDMRSTVAVQLSELTATVTAVSTESAVAREVLSERVASLTARVDKEEAASTVGVETSAQNREKISKMETQLEHCDSRHRESADETSKMRERLTKLETLVEVLMKK